VQGLVPKTSFYSPIPLRFLRFLSFISRKRGAGNRDLNWFSASNFSNLPTRVWGKYFRGDYTHHQALSKSSFLNVRVPVISFIEPFWRFPSSQTLIEVKNARCPHCIAVSLSTGDRDHDNGRLDGHYFVADRMSNMGYAFNRTVWQRIKASACIFCGFDDYGWDWSLECAVMATWEPKLLSLHAAGRDSN
jgi:hypothetical protein